MSKSLRDYSSKQEDYVAKVLDGKVNSNSGATPFYKGDVLVKDVSMLVECKTKTKPSSSFSVKQEWLIKSNEESLAMGCTRKALAISFDNESSYYLIDERMMKEYLYLLRKDLKGEF